MKLFGLLLLGLAYFAGAFDGVSVGGWILLLVLLFPAYRLFCAVFQD